MWDGMADPDTVDLGARMAQNAYSGRRRGARLAPLRVSVLSICPAAAPLSRCKQRVSVDFEKIWKNVLTNPGSLRIITQRSVVHQKKGETMYRVVIRRAHHKAATEWTADRDAAVDRVFEEMDKGNDAWIEEKPSDDIEMLD